MKRNECVLLPLSLCLTTVALAQQAEAEAAKPTEAKANTKDPRAIEILKKVDTAIKKVHSVQYTSKTEATGFLTARVGIAEGTVIESAQPPGGPRKYRIQMTFQRSPSQEGSEFTVGSDGELYYLIDPAKKTVYADTNPAVLGNRAQLAQGYQGIVLSEYLHPTPFDDELNADTVELKEPQEVGNEECHVVRVLYAGGRGESIWFFSKKDYLPRRREMVITRRMSGMKGKIIKTLSNLVVNPTLPDDAFKFQVPEGFKRTDGFAPYVPIGQAMF